MEGVEVEVVVWCGVEVQVGIGNEHLRSGDSGQSK